jgi:hypothetical protein
LTEEEKTGEEAGEGDLLPEEIKSFQVKKIGGKNGREMRREGGERLKKGRQERTTFYQRR